MLAALDEDPRQRPVAAYLGHLYADLKARLFAGVTLYDAWFSTDQLHVPDVDAIPFAVGVLGDRSYRPPIPPDAQRARLSQRIRDAPFAHRRYRTLREAAAAALVAAAPTLARPYDALVPRFHHLWDEAGDDPRALAALMAEHESREDLPHHVDRTLLRDSDAPAARDTRVLKLRVMVERLRDRAIAALPDAR